MKKTYFVFILLIALAFITACSGDKETPPPAAGIEDEPAPPAEPEAPPITVAPENPADKTTFLAPLPNVNNAVIDRATNTVSVDFRNDLELPITLPLTGSWAKYSETECINPQINAIYKGEYVQALVTEIKAGDTFTIKWDCENPDKLPVVGAAFKADLTFNYKTSSGLIKSHIGSINGRYS
jgi:hypothetical protein